MNDDVSKIRRVAAAVEGQLGRRERYHLGAIGPLEAARFHVTIQGAIPGAPRAADGIHPILPSAILAWGDGPPESELLADGNAKETFAGVDLGGLRLMGGGQELEFHRPVEQGVELWMDVEVESVQVKEGRSGEFLAMRLKREFQDADAVLYTTCRETFLAR